MHKRVYWCEPKERTGDYARTVLHVWDEGAWQVRKKEIGYTEKYGMDDLSYQLWKALREIEEHWRHYA